MVELEGSEGGEEGVEVVNCEPLGGFGAAVVFAVGAEAEGGEGVHGGREVVHAAPHFDG